MPEGLSGWKHSALPAAGRANVSCEGTRYSLPLPWQHGPGEGSKESSGFSWQRQSHQHQSVRGEREEEKEL